MSLENRIESLESQISKLTTVMIELNATMQALKSPVPVKEEAPVTLKELLTPVKETLDLSADTLTHEDLKALCLNRSRSKPGLKDKVKGILAAYSAQKATDVPMDKIAEVYSKIEGLA